MEDTSYTYEDIVKRFGIDVADLVMHASEPDKSQSWEERKRHTLNHIKTAPLEAKLIVVCDKISNLFSDIENYNKIGDRIWEKMARGKKDQEWYYRGILDSARHGVSDNKLFGRYETILNYLFVL